MPSWRLPFPEDDDPIGHAFAGELEELVREVERRVGSRDAVFELLDPDAAPADWLEWLAQRGGVSIDGVDGEETRRRRIAEAPQRLRGTPSAVKSAARRYMTGGRQIRVSERTDGDGGADPDWVRVRTYAPETPDQDAVLRALRQAVPADVAVAYDVISGATYAEVSDDFSSYADLDAEFDDYEAQTTYVPEA